MFIKKINTFSDYDICWNFVIERIIRTSLPEYCTVNGSSPLQYQSLPFPDVKDIV